MATKRMLSREIVKTDAFMTMPLTAQALYMHLVMDADDDGFIASPKTLLRATGASEDDLRILLTKNFVIAFESGVLVIKHWRIHNKITESRLKPTNFLEEKALLRIKSNNAYTLGNGRLLADCTQNANSLQADCTQSAYIPLARLEQTRTEQNRLDKSSIEQHHITDLLTETEYEALFDGVDEKDQLELLTILDGVDASKVTHPFAYCRKVAKETGLAK